MEGAVYMNDEELYGLAERVGIALKKSGFRLAAAESCTGGWVAQVLTEVPGSSDWFECALITYSNRSKRQLLGVPESVLDRYGAVSAETVRAMAEGILDCSDATLAVAISGIAGPGGGTPEKPIGTVWIAWLSRHPKFAKTALLQVDGTRQQVRRKAVEAALQGVLDVVRR